MIRGLVDFKNVSGDQVEQYCKNCANLKHLQLFFCATDSLFLRIFNTFNYSELMCVFILFFFRKGVSCFQGNCNMFLILIFYFNKSNYNKLMCTCHKRKLINFLNVSIWSISPHKWVFVLMKSMGSSINYISIRFSRHRTNINEKVRKFTCEPNDRKLNISYKGNQINNGKQIK